MGIWECPGQQMVTPLLTTGFLFNIDTPSVSHKINLGFEMLSNGWYYMNASAKRSKPEGNIYTGIWKVNDGAPMPSSGPWYISSRKMNRSLILTDTISALDGNLRVILGPAARISRRSLSIHQVL